MPVEKEGKNKGLKHKETAKPVQKLLLRLILGLVGGACKISCWIQVQLWIYSDICREVYASLLYVYLTFVIRVGSSHSLRDRLSRALPSFLLSRRM